MTPIPILKTTAQLDDLARKLAQCEAFAFDLEADSMHSYREKICLMQVTFGTETVLIDPFPLPDLDVLKPVMADPSIRKIFHAADYDLRCLHRDFGIQVRGLFDTMICAQLLGEQRIGLADLLARYFDVQLDKRFQRADWSQRPLPDDMLQYAAEDTRHLTRLTELFENRLRERGRMDWAEEEFRLQEQVRFTDSEGPQFLKMKGAGRLDRRQLGILESLLAWRERQAERRDQPPFKVIGNRELLALAEAAPTTIRALENIAALSPRHQQRLGKQLIAAIEQGLALPKEQLPTFPRQARTQRDPEVESRLNVLKKWRTAAAEGLGLDPGVLINNAQLEALARGNPQSQVELEQMPDLKNWQIRELSADLLQRLAKASP